MIYEEFEIRRKAIKEYEEIKQIISDEPEFYARERIIDLLKEIYSKAHEEGEDRSVGYDDETYQDGYDNGFDDAYSAYSKINKKYSLDFYEDKDLIDELGKRGYKTFKE